MRLPFLWVSSFTVILSRIAAKNPFLNRYLSVLDYSNGDKVQYTHDDTGQGTTEPSPCPHNPNIQIINSYRITERADQVGVLTILYKFNNLNPSEYKWNRTQLYLLIEWDMHNLFAFKTGDGLREPY